jgi:hypothetical protein
VSTDGQSVEAQVRQLTDAGCTKVFREVASGALGDRAQLRRLLTLRIPTKPAGYSRLFVILGALTWRAAKAAHI